MVCSRLCLARVDSLQFMGWIQPTGPLDPAHKAVALAAFISRELFLHCAPARQWGMQRRGALPMLCHSWVVESNGRGSWVLTPADLRPELGLINTLQKETKPKGAWLNVLDIA